MIITYGCLHTQALAKLPQPPSIVAVLPHNKAHNRFNNIFPCELVFFVNIQCLLLFSSDDKSRVCLKGTPGVDSCDYINASYIDVRTHTTPTHAYSLTFYLRAMKG